MLLNYLLFILDAYLSFQVPLQGDTPPLIYTSTTWRISAGLTPGSLLLQDGHSLAHSLGPGRREGKYRRAKSSGMYLLKFMSCKVQ